MIPDRKLGPPINPIGNINFPEVTVYTLDNGIPVYEINAGTQDVVKVEIVNIGSRLYEDKKLSSRATSYLMKEETQQINAKDLAEKIDYYGASITTNYNMDTTTISGVFLGKYQEPLIALLGEVFYQPRFSEEEFSKYIERNINELSIELTKNDVVAYRELTKHLYGEDHIYGFNSSIELYKELQVSDCQQYYNDYIGTDNAVIFVAGKISDAIRKNINKNLGQQRKTTFSKKYQPSNVAVARKRFKLIGYNSVQDAICIGRRMFNKNHPDYPALIVYNTILGGYFGSRLMKSVREEHGFTYGINSLYDITRNDGFLYIQTEVAPQYTEATVKEIYSQLDKLSSDGVPSGELGMVKNYILGNILNLLDGPLRSIKWTKSLVLHDQTILQGKEAIQRLRNVTSEEVRAIGQKYFSRDNLMEMIVASKLS